MPAPKFFINAKHFNDWLAAHAATELELLVGFYKVGSGHPSMTWSESIDEALCYGWIDGVRKRFDDAAYTIRFTPRKTTSIWSAVNINKFNDLQQQGRMTPAGKRPFPSALKPNQGFTRSSKPSLPSYRLKKSSPSNAK